MSKIALITGITGQDGSYLAELLLDKGYEVHGTVRRISQPNVANLAVVLDRITLHTADMQDGPSLVRIIESLRPDEIYNFAAMSHVRDSYDHPDVTQDINAGGLLRILEAVRLFKPDAKVYQACSSEMFGRVQETPQNEGTPFYPRSPYGSSKVTAFNHARLYREAYGMNVYCGILFNHESPRRGEAFLSRKVCKAVAEIAHGRREKLILGNLDAKRDWGYAKEYVEWIYRIMQHPTADDFVIATGESYSVRDWVKAAFEHVGIINWESFVEYDRSLTRPAEVDTLCGDASKSKQVLGFEPKVRFKELVGIMVDSELEKLSEGQYLTHSDERRELYSFPDAKLIVANQDTVIGKHYHKIKSELFMLSAGEGYLTTPTGTERMIIGERYLISPGTYHEFKLTKGSVLIGLNSHAYNPRDDYRMNVATP